MNGDDRRKLFVDGNETPLIEDLRVARRFWERACGLLGRAALQNGEALLIPRCAAVHTFGMRFPIDILFVDNVGKIHAVFPETPSGHVVLARRSGVNALEAEAGFARAHGLTPGQLLVVQPELR